jgi:hypothetical protein
VEVGFRSKEVLLLLSGKHDYIIVHCRIVHCKLRFLGTFVNAHLVVHCVGVPHVIRVIIVLLHMLIMLLLLLLLSHHILGARDVFASVHGVDGSSTSLTFLHIVNHVVGALSCYSLPFVVGTILVFTLFCKLELHWR